MEWKVSDKPVEYQDALNFMDERVTAIHERRADDMVWLLEHPSLYTGGTSAKSADLLNPQFPVYETGRGGEYTYHGPGQRIAYVMMDLKKRGAPDVKKYVCDLERWVIAALEEFGIKGECRTGRIGIWAETPEGEKKIAAIGVRVRHWITLHGIAVNIDPDLSHFNGIVPCGIKDYGVTSVTELLGKSPDIQAFDAVLQHSWKKIFG